MSDYGINRDSVTYDVLSAVPNSLISQQRANHLKCEPLWTGCSVPGISGKVEEFELVRKNVFCLWCVTVCSVMYTK